MFQTEPNVCQSSSLSYSTQRCMLTPCKHVHWCGLKCSIPASALMRERSKRRAELFSLSQSVSAARSQRLLMSLYCCWISKLSKSVGEMVLMVSRLEENTFNLQFRHRDTEASEVNACREGRGRYVILEDWPLKCLRANVWKIQFRKWASISISSAARWCTVTHVTHTLSLSRTASQLHSRFICSNDSDMQKAAWTVQLPVCNEIKTLR